MGELRSRIKNTLRADLAPAGARLGLSDEQIEELLATRTEEIISHISEHNEDKDMLKEGQKSANIMVCSDCGSVIARKDSDEKLFDIFDCSWECPICKRLWLSSHGWEEVGNLLIPYGVV